MSQDAVEVVDLASQLPIPLTADDLDELRFAVNLMRVTVPAAHAPSFHFGALQGASQQVEKSLATLRKDLPKLIKHHRDFDSERAAESAEVLAKVLAAADAYFNERWIAWGGRTPSRRHEWWHDDAIYLHFILDNAARQQRRDLSFSYGTAPAVAFIDAALNRAKVQHDTPEAIARMLARYEERMKDKLKTMLKNCSAISVA